MPRTLPLEQLQRALAEGEGLAAPRTRREVLKGAGVAAAAAGAWWMLGCGGSGRPPATERIVVVGGGLAGLSCAYRLRQAGHRAIVHEASERLGGRCWTIRDAFAEGQIAEHGGELIDSDHTAIRALIAELGLRLNNVLGAEKPGTEDVYYFDRGPYPLGKAVEDFQAIAPLLKREVAAAGYPTFYDHHTRRGAELDRMSIVDWIEQNVPGGTGSRLGELLEVAYNTEFGAEPADQSALNLIYLLGYSGGGRLRLFGASNEKFHVDGGNDQIVSRLADRLQGQLALGSRLVSISARDGGGYELGFDQSGGHRTVRADRVLLALPFTVLRSSVDYSGAGFSELKRTAIEQLGMGTNSKLNVQFSDRHWRAEGANGSTFADTGYQSTWEASRAQPGRAGILVEYTGGRTGRLGGSLPAREHADRFLAQLEPVLPGLSRRFNGRAVFNHWPSDPFTLGSYSYYRVGQMTEFAGVEHRPSGNCHFAGEHTAYTFQGYLEGGVRSGERAAKEILAGLRPD